jgi:predicted amidophosphoribosyltransferase
MAGLWCSACRARWEHWRVDARKTGALGTAVVLPYAGEPRRWIHRAKVTGEPRVVLALAEMFAREARVIEAARGCDGVMAAPSSLWGRLRGRFDLAGALAESLARALGKPLVVAPSRLFWSWRKKAMSRHRPRSDGWAEILLKTMVNTRSGEWSPPVGVKRVLVVDDVVTTGTTLKELSAALAGVETRTMALAGKIQDRIKG